MFGLKKIINPVLVTKFVSRILINLQNKAYASQDFCGKLKRNEVPTFTQSDGSKIPAIGLGTAGAKAFACEDMVSQAIDAGYRLIDTAYIYENEKDIGRAVKEKVRDGVVKREELYIITKLWNHFHCPEVVARGVCLSQKNLCLGPIDMLILHYPFAFPYYGDKVYCPINCKGEVLLSKEDYICTWKEMEKLVDTGVVKSLGVGNFNKVQLEKLMCKARIMPQQNHIECHPLLNNKDLIKACQCMGVLPVAYGVLTRPDPCAKFPPYLFDEKVKTIACKHNKTPAQVVIRYIYELGAVPIIKTVNPLKLQENIDIFDFKLTDCEKQVMNEYNLNFRRYPMCYASKSEFYPF